MPTLMETTLKFDCTRLEEQVLINKEKDTQLDRRVTALEGKETPVYTPMDLDLNTGVVAVTYDTTDGISLTTQGTIKANTGTDQVVVDYEIPIVAGNNILIDKKADEDKIEVKLDQSKDIKLIGGSTNSVYFTSDSSASFGAPEGFIYSSFGDENGIPRIRQKDPGGLRTYTFPTNTYGEHTVLTNKYVKTLFGNKSIYGSGNIDLYVHNMTFVLPDGNCYARWISSKNLVIDSLTDLKTVFGNTFKLPLFGDVPKSGGVAVMITESKLIMNELEWNYSDFTITDTVTTV